MNGIGKGPKEGPRTASFRSRWLKWLGWGVLAGGTLFMVAPFVIMVATSLKAPDEIFSGHFSLWPHKFYGLKNYVEALSASPLYRYMLNGLIVCAAILVLQLVTCLPCGYALAKISFRGNKLLFSLILLGILIPAHAPAIPLYIMFWAAGLLNTWASLILPFGVSAFGLFLFRQFFKSIPDDLIDAARMDGMNDYSIIWRVIIPLAAPAITAFAIFSFAGNWNGLFWPMIVITKPELAPPTLGIILFRDEEAGISYGPLMAAATMVNLPVLLGFLFAQKKFIQGMTSTGVR